MSSTFIISGTGFVLQAELILIKSQNKMAFRKVLDRSSESVGKTLATGERSHPPVEQQFSVSHGSSGKYSSGVVMEVDDEELEGAEQAIRGATEQSKLKNSNLAEHFGRSTLLPRVRNRNIKLSEQWSRGCLLTPAELSPGLVTRRLEWVEAGSVWLAAHPIGDLLIGGSAYMTRSTAFSVGGQGLLPGKPRCGLTGAGLVGGSAGSS